MSKPTKKAFREYLNAMDAGSENPISYKNYAYGQRTRLYGDYLYNQDREKFAVEYEEWISAGFPTYERAEVDDLP